MNKESNYHSWAGGGEFKISLKSSKLSDWRQFSNNVDETHIYLEREPKERIRSHVQQERDPYNGFGQIDYPEKPGE